MSEISGSVVFAQSDPLGQAIWRNTCNGQRFFLTLRNEQGDPLETVVIDKTIMHSDGFHVVWHTWKDEKGRMLEIFEQAAMVRGIR